MVSIRALEKMLRPYWVGSGASTAYTMYDEYKRGNFSARVDEADINPFGKMLYKQTLENAARRLGLKIDKKEK